MEKFEKTNSNEINVLSLFFHDIMKILTSFVLKRNELVGPFPPYKDIIEYKLQSMPYIDYLDIKTGINLTEKNYSYVRSTSLMKSLFYSLNFYFKKILFSPDYTIGIRGVKDLKNGQVIKQGNNLFIFKKLFSQKIYISTYGKQIKIISSEIRKICKKLNCLEHFSDINEIINNHIYSFIDYKNSHNLKCDLIITGSMCSIQNRILGFQASYEGIKVLTCSHGEGDQLLTNEPKIGYGEKSSVDYFLGYGIQGEYSNDNYSNSLNKNQKYISSNSESVLKIYTDEQILPINSLRRMKWMYVSDSLQYHNRIGPYCNIQDNIYLIWQGKLLSSFPNLIYKRHPKGHKIFREISTIDLLKRINSDCYKRVKIIEDDFENVYKYCDGYLFDMISTAFMLACATNKPIAYFNIGKRNLSTEGEKLVKSRCLWVDIDPLEDMDLIKLLRPLKNKQFTNQISKSFSFYDDRNEHKRIFSIYRAIDTILTD